MVRYAAARTAQMPSQRTMHSVVQRKVARIQHKNNVELAHVAFWPHYVHERVDCCDLLLRYWVMQAMLTPEK